LNIIHKYRGLKRTFSFRVILNKCKIILAESSELRAAVGMKNGHYKINKKSS
jgi:hypothetical protein